MFRLVRIGNAREKCHPGNVGFCIARLCEKSTNIVDGRDKTMNTSVTKIQWSAASFALVVASALLAGSTSRATGAEAGAQESRYASRNLPTRPARL